MPFKARHGEIDHKPIKVTYNRPINITKEQWIALLQDEEIICEKDLRILEALYCSHDYTATGLQLAQILHMPHHAPINRQIGRLGRKIVERLGIPAIERTYGGGFEWWNTLFLGSSTPNGFLWILRPELVAAMQELDEEREILLGEGAKLPEEVDTPSQEDLYEGSREQIYVNRYERNSRARYLCIARYGTMCMVCGFDFEQIYGEAGKNFIHVHHLIPLSEIQQEYQVDPEKDLRPVCPNCHAMIHRRNPPYSLEEVIEMIAKQKGALT